MGNVPASSSSSSTSSAGAVTSQINPTSTPSKAPLISSALNSSASNPRGGDGTLQGSSLPRQSSADEQGYNNDINSSNDLHSEFGSNEKAQAFTTVGGLAVSSLILAAALISYNQATHSKGSKRDSNKSSKRQKNDIDENEIFSKRADYWYSCGISVPSNSQYAQYRFPVFPERLKEEQSLLDEIKNKMESKEKDESTTKLFDAYRYQVEVLQQCLPEDEEKIEILEQIDRDIPRTFPERNEFGEEKMRKSLQRVLIAVAATFPHVGYVQGQNFLAAFLLVHTDQDEDVAFCLLRMLMEHPKYKMHEMMMHGLPKLVRLSELLELLVRKHYPKVQEYFDKIGLDTLLYSQNWIQTIFSYAMKFNVLTQVWDLFFEDGWHGFLRVCLALIGDVQDKIIGSNFESCVNLLRQVGSEPSPRIPEIARAYKLSAEEELKITEVISIDEPIIQIKGNGR